MNTKSRKRKREVIHIRVSWRSDLDPMFMVYPHRNAYRRPAAVLCAICQSPLLEWDNGM